MTLSSVESIYHPGVIDCSLKASFLTILEEDDLVFEDNVPNYTVAIADNGQLMDQLDRLTLSDAEASQPSSSSIEPASSDKDSPVFVDFAYKKRAVGLWRSGLKKKYSFKTVKNQFPRLKDDRTLRIWGKQVDRGGCRSDKILRIYQSTLAQFEDAKANK